MKSLVEEYFVLRTNAIQRRRFQNDQVIIPYLLKYSLMYQIEKEHMFTILCIIKNISTAENILWYHKDSASIWQFLSVSTLQMTYVSNFMNFHEILKICGTICMIVSAFLASPSPGVTLGVTWFFCFVIFGFWKTWLMLHILNLFKRSVKM